jgi:hypothetical protein
MLFLRPLFEPWMPAIVTVVGVVVRLFSKHMHGGVTYGPAAYPWIVGGVYALSVLWLAVACFAAYAKPASDRRVDQYLRRKFEIAENDHIQPLSRSSRRER